MKKRIVSIIVVMILLVSMLSGCGLITLNAERDGAQIVSTVDVDGLHGVVTKADLMGIFNQLGIMYIQYYGMAPKEVIDEFVTQLSNREIVLLYAIKEIAPTKNVSLDTIKTANNKYVENIKAEGTRKYDKNMRPFDLFQLVEPDEQFYVIKQTKKSLEDSYKTLVEEVKAEFEANAPIEETKPEDDKKPEADKKDEKELEPRPTKTVSPAANEFKKDSSITMEAVKAEKTFFEEKQTAIKNKELTKVEEEAFNRLVKNLHKNYKGKNEDESIKIAWNNMLDAQKEARLLTKYQNEIVNKGVGADPTEITSRYNFKVSADVDTVFDKDSYKTAIEADKENKLLVHNNETGYFTVKSILLKFNEDQTKALNFIKNGVLCDTDNYEMISELREKLASNDNGKGFGVVGVGDNIGGIKVNVSNPNYDKDAVCDVKDCPCKACTNNKDYKQDNKCDVVNCPCVACKNHAYTEKDVDYNEILNRMSTALANAGANITYANGLTLDDNQKKAAALNAKMDVFDDYIYLVNDDPGMFNSTGYVMNDKGDSQYVAEYVALGRELAKKAVTDKTVGVVGGLVGAGRDSISVANPIDDTKPNIIIHKAQSADGEEINYIVNDFGIHIIMVNYYVAQNDKTTLIKDGNYRLNEEYTVKYENVYKTDDKGKVIVENGKKTLVELKNKTVKDIISDEIIAEKKADNYSKKEKEITENKAFKTEKNDKLIGKVIKDIEKELKKQGYDPHQGHNHQH